MRLIHGDCLAEMRRLIDEGVTVHSVVTDPPYGLTSVVKRFGKDGSAPAKSEGPTGVYKRSSAGFMGQCYHPDTDILTSAGWRRIGDVREGDVVATLNPATRDVEWQAVEQSHAYPFSGQMVRVGHRSACQVVTPNHNVLLSYDGGETLRFDEARKIGRVFHLFAQANPARGETGDVTLTIERDYGKDRARVQETRTYPAKPFFRFLGLWLGDGAVCNRTDDHPANDFITFSVKKPRKVERLRETLRDLGVRFTETPGARNITFYCYDFVLLETLRPLGGAKEKHIPRWVLDRDADDIEEVYQGLIETDGCVQGKGQHVYHTASRQLADDFQDLCLRTGRSASSKYDPGGQTSTINGRSFVSGESWTLCVLQPGKRLYGENGRGSSNVVSLVDYDGPVFCVGVARHHTLYTRFEGKPVWSGNSWDGTGIETNPETWRLCFDLLKPGGYLLAFGGTRTWHRIAVAIEDAGFEIRDTVAWLFGVGFPKSHNISNALDGERCRCESEPATERDMRRLSDADVPAPVNPGRELLQVLQSRLPEQSFLSSSRRRASACDGASYRSDKPVLERRGDVPTQERELRIGAIRSLPGEVQEHGPQGWVRDGASLGDGSADRSRAESYRGGASHRPRSAQQHGGEPRIVAEQRQPQEGGAWTNCGRCGKPRIPSGLGTALKPAFEPIIVARKPLIGTVAQNVLTHGTGALNVDGCRVPGAFVSGWSKTGSKESENRSMSGKNYARNPKPDSENGRWPANVVHDGSDEVETAFAAFGERPGQLARSSDNPDSPKTGRVYGRLDRAEAPMEPRGDSGTASRFFYCTKATRQDRNEGLPNGSVSTHPTVKPTELMRWLCRLVTPPGGTVLDPFMGSGSTGKAAALEGFDFIGIEQSAEYLAIAEARIGYVKPALSLPEIMRRAAEARARLTEALRAA